MAQGTEVGWPTCDRVRCTGIRLDAARTCLAHCTKEERAGALKLVGETGAIDARGVPIAAALLEQVLAAVPRGTNGEPLIKNCQFDKATFTDDAKFSAATFTGEASFNEATFTGDAEFSAATFTGDARFSAAAFTGDARFNEATFTGDARFSATTFTRDAEFDQAMFSGDAEFSEAAFNGDARFFKAAFTGDAEFSAATFTRVGRFDRAMFSGDAGFSEAIFTGYAGFSAAAFTRAAMFNEAAFTGAAFFGEATFSAIAWFKRTTFTGDATFNNATFKRLAVFSAAIFTGAGGFSEATFIGAAKFDGVTFEQAHQFGPLLAYRGLELDKVQFGQPVRIEVSTTGLCCRQARFPSGVQFRLRWARVVLDDADLPAPSTLTGVPLIGDSTWHEREQRIARAWQRLMASEISERPQLLSLRRANVAGLGLSNVTATDCRFVGAHNLDKLRLEPDVSFATAPIPLGSGGRRWGGREVIAEERAWRADHTTRRWLPPPIRALSRRWAAPSWPARLDDQRPGVLDPGQIAGLYRALRKGREDIKDEPGAADFYYGEMEMRRLARSASDGPADTPARTTSRGRVERGILTIYWLVSGYGLRAWRAIACLAIVTAFLAVAFHLIGFTRAPQPNTYWTSALYAFRATLSLTDNEVTLTSWGQLLQAILRLTGPVLLGLALLALRGRLKR